MTISRTAILSAGGLALLLVATGFVAATTPSANDWEQPFAVHAPVGEHAQGRNIAATVHGVTVADAVFDSRWQSTPGSTWVIVDATAAVVTNETAALIGRAALIVGDRTYLASTRPSGFALNAVALSIGVPTRGSLVFELPGDILADPAASVARLELAIPSDPRMDSMLVTTLDLTAAPVLDEAELVDAEWGMR